MTEQEMWLLDSLRVREYAQVDEIDIRKISYLPHKIRWFRKAPKKVSFKRWMPKKLRKKLRNNNYGKE